MSKHLTIIDAMRDTGNEFTAGLTPSEFAEAEEHHGFRFPPNLRSFLAEALPVGERFPDWRKPQSEQLASMQAWPLDGLLFDVEHNDFWLKEWGERPRSLDDAFTVAKRAGNSGGWHGMVGNRADSNPTRTVAPSRTGCLCE